MSKLIYGLFLVRPLLWILRVPRERLMPVVFVLCVVGAYAITSRVFDIYVMVTFGILGFILRMLKFPMPPLILGLVLGDLLENNLTRGLVLSGGSLAPFFLRPVSGVLAATTLLSIAWSIPAAQDFVTAGLRRIFGRRALPAR